MNRTITALAGIGATLALAACGSAAATQTGASKSSSSSSNNAPRRGGATAGELVRIGGTSLVLNTQSGDVTVDYTSGTTVSKTRTGTVADIATGMCITATGQKDASGNISISQVVLNSAVNGSCSGNFLFGGGRGGPGGGAPSPGATPRPSFSPRPGVPPIGVVRGQVTGVSGTSVTVMPLRGGSSQTITVPTTVHVTVVDSASAADLAVGDCVLAAGQKNSSGVVNARSLTVVPAGANGCFSGGGGFGGFGRGGFGGGGGGGGGFGGGGFGGGGEGEGAGAGGGGG